LEAIKNPLNWWTGLQKEIPVLGKFAIQIMSILASSVASEYN
ncbi:1977_t:CDS:1, partial [Rhizophagus irregularis]